MMVPTVGLVTRPGVGNGAIPMTMPLSYRGVEVLTGVERRRRYSMDEKVRLVAEAAEPGMSVSLVARRHGVNPSLLFRWRQLLSTDRSRPVATGLVPIRIADEGMDRALAPSLAPSHECTDDDAGSLIEIVLTDGRRVRVDQRVDASALRRVLAALAPS